MIVFAHTGHVLIDLSIFLGPVAALVAWLYLADWRERRRNAADAGESKSDGG